MITPEYDFLAGGGEMGALMRSMDWSATALGPVEGWPQSLRTSVSTCLNSRFPILIWWGPDFIKIYNDAYREIIADKHPRAMGQRGRECWPEIWHIIGPMLEGVLERGEATWSENQLLILVRHGFPEECYFTFSYSPIRDETGIAGVFSAVTETTGVILGERRLRMLRNLAARAASVKSEDEAWRVAVEGLREDPEDLPFALLYRAGAGQESVHLAGAAGIEPAGARAPLAIDLGTGGGAPWPIAEAAASGEPALVPGAMVLPLARAGGSPYGYLVAGLSPRRPLDEEYRGFLALAADHVAAAVANARAYEEERRRAEELAGLDRAKTAFFSNVSHEFRTPLTLILGPVEDALSDRQAPLPPAQRERLELARRSGQRLQKLVNTLLDFSRIEAGRAQASYAPTDLAGLTADLASAFRSAVEKAGLRLTVECPLLPDAAYVDRDMWEKVVLNLLSNALKFTFEGEIGVRLRQEGDRFELAVTDTGSGIPAHELPRVFDRFHRIEGTRSRTHEGTGIGLALVQEVVRLHGGTVRAESAKGRGSTFTVSIPAGHSHLPADRVRGRPASSPAAAGAELFVTEALHWLPHAASPPADVVGEAPTAREGGPRPRIVWADDNADMREYVRRLLAPLYDVDAVADGTAALEAVRARRPDLVLADGMMPNLDGLALVRALRADPATRPIPVVLLSARAGEESRIEALDAGADDYVHKPFGAKELLARVSARLELARLQRRLDDERADLAALFAQAPVPIAVLRGRELVFELANPAYVEVVGGREVLGRSLVEALPEVTAQGFDVLLKEVMATGKPRIGREALIRLQRNGQVEDTYWTFIYGPMRGPGGVDRVIAICSEVTEQVVARERLRRSEERLREMDRRKDEFLATLSHELRNPLAPLRNALHILRLSGRQEEPTARIHEMMERQLNHLVRLVDDLLEVSRINRGTFELRRERVELASVVRNAVETSAPLIQAGGHALELALPDEPVWLDGDPVRLSQIFANLLNNAAKYTEHGGRIHVTARRDGDAVQVSVCDTGVGISPEMLPTVFEMFSRGDRTRIHSDGGLGVGLALAHRLALMHGGAIAAHSEGRGQGSEFTVRLPAAAEHAPRPDVRSAREAALIGTRVLVVDDNRDAAESLGVLLEALGAEVRVVRDGGEALEAFSAYSPAVVVLDVGMPGMDGYEVARRIRASDPERRAALVALTGWGQEEDRRRARLAGFDHHLIKPAQIDALQALLASLGGAPATHAS